MALKTAEMRPKEERRGLTSRRSLAAGSATWSEGNDGGGRHPGVVLGSSRRWVVVLGGAVLEVIGEGLERRSVAAQWWWVWWGLEQ
jgi:hypothetical protein